MQPTTVAALLVVVAASAGTTAAAVVVNRQRRRDVAAALRQLVADNDHSNQVRSELDQTRAALRSSYKTQVYALIAARARNHEFPGDLMAIDLADSTGIDLDIIFEVLDELRAATATRIGHDPTLR